MKQAILELIDRKIEKIRYYGDMEPLQELRSEIEKMDEWIPTDDVGCELLQCEGEYLVYDGRNIRVAYFVKGKGFGYLGSKIYITHWQPLPLPPNN